MEYFLVVFEFCSMTQQHFTVTEYFPYLLPYKKVSEEKLNHVGIKNWWWYDKLFRDLLTNKIYSR